MQAILGCDTQTSRTFEIRPRADFFVPILSQTHPAFL